MFNFKQQTIVTKVELKGVGLHSGLTSNMRLLPAKENTGITFKRVDLKENNIIKAKQRCCRTESHTFKFRIN